MGISWVGIFREGGDSPVGSLIGGSSLGVNLPGRNFPDTNKYFSFTKVGAANVLLRLNYL